MRNHQRSSVFDVANGIDRREANAVGSFGECDGGLKEVRGLAVAKIPKKLVGVGGTVGKLHHQIFTDGVHIGFKVDARICGHTRFEVHFNDAEVAVARVSGRTHDAGRRGKPLAAARGAHRLVNVSAGREARGSAVDVLAR